MFYDQIIASIVLSLGDVKIHSEGAIASKIR